MEKTDKKNMHHQEHEKPAAACHAAAEKDNEKMPKSLLALLGLAVVLLLVNQVQIQALNSMTGMAVGSSKLTGELAQDAMTLVISRGLPAVYGGELGVTFEDPVSSMEVLASMDPTYGARKIALEGEELARYTKIGSMIACEFCCGAKTLVFSNGQAACGCKHSWAMRGLAAYLIKYHGGEYSDEEVLSELAKWKGLFFPRQMVEKLTQQLGSGQYTPDITALLLRVDEKTLEKLGSSAPPAISELPGMVGGC